MQYNYFSKRNQMSAILKRDIHANLQRSSDRLARKKRTSYRATRDGTAVVDGVKMDVAVQPISGRDRHELAWKKL